MSGDKLEPQHRSPVQHWLPWIALLILAAIISSGVYRKTEAARVPPVFDAFSYYAKAYLVWEEIKAGHPERVFSVGYTSRPPGSTVIVAPFGFRDVRNDFRGFFFRSIMVPALMVSVAAGLLLVPSARGLSGRWLAAGVIGSLMAMPMFYQMEIEPAHPRSYTWGFIDCTVAAFAALSLALLLASIQKYRLWMSLTGGALLAWTIFLKPVGLLLIPLLFGQWVVEMLIRHWPLRACWRKASSRARRYVIVTTIALPFLFLSVTLVSISTPYLSRGNLAAAIVGQGILLGMTSAWQMKTYFSEISWGMGYIWFPIFCLCVLWAFAIILRLVFLFRVKLSRVRVVYAFLGLCGALYWWVAMAGPQDRYLFPFQLCFLLTVFPLLWEKLQEKAAPLAKSVLAGALLVPPSFLSWLLWTSPSPALQATFRVNLNAGDYEYSMRAAETLLQRVGPEATAIRYYKPDQSWSIGAMEACILTRDLIRPETPELQPFCALDWVRPILVRRQELVNADFIVIQRLPHADTLLALTTVSDAPTEVALAIAWLGQIGPNEGVELLQDGPLRLMQVTDRVRLDEAFVEWMKGYEFRPEFYVENGEPVKRTRWRLAIETGERLLLYPDGARPAIRPLADARIEKSAEGLIIDASGVDPQLQLPTVRLPAGTRLSIRAELFASTGTGAEIFWTSSGEQGKGDTMQRLSQETFHGWNEVYFDLPPAAGETELRLRFDPGWESGRYIVRKLELISFPDDAKGD